MKPMTLTEAFKELDLLNEDTFKVDDEGVNELKDFIEDDEKDETISIIDPEAEDESEIEDNYVGKAILDCKVCHSKLYKDMNDVVIDEESEVANIEDECPYCYATEGFEVIGKVAEINDNELEEKEESDEELEECYNNHDYGNSAVGHAVSPRDTYLHTEKEPLTAKQKWLKDHGLSYKNEELGEGIFGFGKKKKADTNSSSKRKIKDSDYVILMKSTVRDNDYVYTSVVGEDKGKVTQIAKQLHPTNGYTRIVVSYDEAKKLVGEPLDDEMVKIQEGLTEGINDISLTTDEFKMDMTDDNGKITVTTEPISNDTEMSGEVIEPLDDEDINSIESNGEEEVEEEVDEFSEEEFDELGESYLKEIYDNVKSFKTSNVSSKGNCLIVEGLIGFKSGKTKKTTFKFEAKEITKRNKVKFLGENCQITKNQKAFTLIGNIRNGKLTCESLNYKYSAKDLKEGKMKKIYGTKRLIENKSSKNCI